MVNRSKSLKIRKAHRHLGLFLGIQFLLWTLSGLYFSWTNIDEIHSDQYKNLKYEPKAFDSLISPSLLNLSAPIQTIEIRDLNLQPYYFVNKKALYHARSGQLKGELTKDEAVYIAGNSMKKELEVSNIKKITKTGNHLEYRIRLLPAYVITYKTIDHLKTYVSIVDANFQTVRHRSWRWFDFLWMTHTMDYQGRDDINTSPLSVFSLLGLIAVLSGFLLWYVSCPSIRKLIP